MITVNYMVTTFVCFLLFILFYLEYIKQKDQCSHTTTCLLVTNLVPLQPKIADDKTLTVLEFCFY